MNFLVAIVLIPILGIAASAPSKSDVIQVSSSEDMDDDENSVSTTPSPRDDCTKGCQILVVDTSEADKRCQGNVRLVPLLEGDPVYLALEGTECRPGNSPELHVCRRGFWIKKPAAPKFTIECPDDIAYVLKNGQEAKEVSWESPSISGESNVSVLGSPPSGSVFHRGVTVVTLEATDEEMNTAKCTFTVNIL
ncbi:uncharacterized protein LOC124257315 [Haliotis rubra]|uniref:uncharacterized protein LOC124257315 n=1 Tax=Haliotis rubra TaxID=36100 RepID=UPI001EE5AEC7|nr:uncharacterized protein LOC124257315 [Haliotis rubra]